MSSGTFGGNRVTVVSLDDGATTLADDAYRYSIVALRAGETHTIPGQGSWTVYVLTLDQGATVTCAGTTFAVSDSLQIEQEAAVLTAVNGTAVLLISGVLSSPSSASRVEHHAAATHYRVTKPWGHELWLNGEHPQYCLKEVFIRAGHRTSLQYHRHKRETNLLSQGRARLVYRHGESGPPDAVTSDDLAFVDLEPISTVDVTPFVLHRLEALTDVYLYETSTPHLDDVVRVQDDARRGDGRIAGEHVP